jgi:hypothetical protein
MLAEIERARFEAELAELMSAPIVYQSPEPIRGLPTTDDETMLLLC